MDWKRHHRNNSKTLKSVSVIEHNDMWHGFCICLSEMRFLDIRKSGSPQNRTSENPEIRTCGNLDFRKSGKSGLALFSSVGVSENLQRIASSVAPEGEKKTLGTKRSDFADSRKVGQSGFPEFRKSGNPDFWKSGFADFRISGKSGVAFFVFRRGHQKTCKESLLR